MADIRIKDLTTTASSTASDDFIAVDGTTNGTRKLNAFSPTFGGNATVTGTLTVSGTGASSFGGRLAIGATALSDRMFYVSGSTGTTGASQFSAVVNPTIPNTVTTGAYGLYLGTNIATGATVTNGYSLFIAAPDYTGSTVTNKYGLYSNDPNPSYFVGNVLVGSTTASTSTSSGALVVGNGTSGGLGVGGAIWAGGDITISTNTKAFYNLNYANAKGQQAGFFSRGTDGAWTAGMHFYSSNTDYSASIIHFPGTGDLQFYTNSTSSNYTSSDEALRITPAKQIQVKATTGSTGTSSGALVVSGGVGVAGAVNAGTFYGLVDGVTAPATESGYARIYVDSADGDLKVKFGDGTVKTIATDS